MIYITIPEHMAFKCIEVTDTEGNSVTEDHFVDARDTIAPESCLPSISIQKAVREFLSTHHRDAEIQGLHLYKKKPHGKGDFLEYQPNRNGKLPTEKQRIFMKKTPPKSENGIPWFNCASATLGNASRARVKDAYEKRMKVRQRVDSHGINFT